MTLEIDDLVVPGNDEHWLLPSKSVAHVAIKRGMPCITILVHGVNDVGEAFPYQERGICTGLNKRLCRSDISPGDWALPPKKITQEKYADSDVHPDPDKVYFQRAPDQGTSPVIPFYWGFREKTTKANTKERHGQYLDQYGNRIDKRYGKNGGPFANATTNIPDMFGPGFVRNLAIEIADPKDGTHPLESAPPRKYMVLAAQRLAALLRIIRKNSPNEPVNIVAHSQGCFVTLLAHAFLAQDGNGVKADTIILNNPPYSVDEPVVEQVQTGSDQQTRYAREQTLIALIAGYITASPASVPIFTAIKEAGDGVVGKEWAHDQRKERDNRGKLYLYFSPDDGTVGLPNIQGIGWWGVYEEMRSKLGSRFYQRLFAAPKGANPSAPAVGSEPHKISLSFKWNAGLTFPRQRLINAEPLPNSFIPELGEETLRNGVIDAAIATTNKYNKKGKEGIRPDETPEHAQARWLNEFGENSYHSGIVSNTMHSEFATANDISIGISSIMKNNYADLIMFLRAVADWRTNWFGKNQQAGDPSFPPPPHEVIKILEDISQVDQKDSEIVIANYDYYNELGAHPGTLPDLTWRCKVQSLAPYIVSETKKEVRQRDSSHSHEYGS